MAGAEIASAYVRIRANLTGFAQEVAAGVDGAFSSLKGTAAFASGTRLDTGALTGATAGMKAAYVETGEAASLGAKEQILAAKDAAANITTSGAEASKGALAAAVGVDEATAAIKTAYVEQGEAAGVAASKQVLDARDAATGVSLAGAETAKGALVGALGIDKASAIAQGGFVKTAAAAEESGRAAEGASAQVSLSADAMARNELASSVKTVASNRELIASYRALAAAAVAGSDEQKLALARVADLQEETNARLRLSASETKENVGGIASSLKGLVATVGLTFGAFQGFEFLKGVVESAAAGQKALESVKVNFGQFAGAITGFAGSAARSLNISSTAAIGTASKFGLLFSQLGVGRTAATDMTIGWEKLAGALSKIQGVNASGALAAVTSAAEGNVKALKSYGIIIDATTQKTALLKDKTSGYISGALTPAQKALANYLIATGRLPGLLDQAAKHSQDAADKTQQLAVDWSDAKSDIGTALLPAVQKLIGGISDWLTKAEDSGRLQRDVNNAVKDGATVFNLLKAAIEPVASTIGSFVSIVGGLKNALLLLAGAYLVVKLAAINLTEVQRALDASFLANPIGIALVALVALGVAFKEAYDHSAKFREIVGEIGDFFTNKLLPGIESFIKKVEPDFSGMGKYIEAVWQSLEVLLKSVWAKIQSDISAVVTVITYIWQHWGSTIYALAVEYFGYVVEEIKNVLKIIEGVIDLATGLITGNWTKAWKGLKEIAKGSLDQVWDTIKLWGDTAATIFSAIWGKIEILTLEAVIKLLGYVNKFTGAFSRAANSVTSFLHIQGLTGKVGDPLTRVIGGLDLMLFKLKEAPVLAAAAARSLKQLAPNTVPKPGSFYTAGQGDFGPAATAAATAAARAQGTAIRKALTENQLLQRQLEEDYEKENADKIADALFGKNIKEQIAAAALKVSQQITNGGRLIQSAMNSVNNYLVAGEAKEATLATKVTQTQTNLQQYILNGTLGLQHTIATNNQTLQNVVDEAQDNLNSISNRLQSLGAKLLKQKLAVGGASSNSLITQLAGSLLGGGHNEAQAVHIADQLATASTANSGTSKLVSQTITQFKASVQQIFAREQHGRIDPKQLFSQLSTLFSSQNLTGSSAAKLLGPQIVDQILANIKGARTQFEQYLKATPAERAKANAATGDGLGPKIVNVGLAIQTAHFEDQRANRAYYNGLNQRLDAQKALLVEQRNYSESFHRGLSKQLAHLITVEDTQSEKLAADRLHEANTIAGDHLRVAQRALTQASAQTALQTKISTTQTKLLASTNALKTLRIGSTQFPTPTGRNPGHAAKDAHSSTSKGLNN